MNNVDSDIKEKRKTLFYSLSDFPRGNWGKKSINNSISFSIIPVSKCPFFFLTKTHRKPTETHP